MPNREIFINGPKNVARLEGKVFGIKKVVYLFMDIHMPVSQQTQCDTYKAVDIKNYLAHELANTDKQIDFFLEIDQRMISTKIGKERNMYIVELTKFFREEFKRSKDGKALNPDISPKVRLHYLDIRDIVYKHIFAGAFKLEYDMNVIDQHDYDFDEDALAHTKDNTQKLSNSLQNLKDMLSSDIKIRDDAKLLEHNKDAYTYINKIRNKYKHPEIKKGINRLLDDVVSQLNECLDRARDLIKYIDTAISNQRLNHKELSIKFYALYGHVVHTSVPVTDAFLLRRLLDKDYITTALVYTGADHSLNYIHYLVNEHDFKITHVSYPEFADYERLTKEVKKYKEYLSADSDSYKHMAKLFYPEKIVQCSNLTDFPRNFD